MKITKKQLVEIIQEQIERVAKDDIEDAVMDVLSDEGGAAGIEPIEDALEDLEDDDVSLPEDPIEDVISSVTGVKRHADGDYVDTTKLEGRKMKVTKRQLRQIIKEEVLKESLAQNVRDLLDQDYEIANTDTKYPYGRNRGDVRSTTVYSRKDGQPVPPEDLKLLQDRDQDILDRGGPMAALGGIYTSTLSPDGNSLIVKYYKHTAG